MNDKNINTQVYAQKVELLLRLMPIIMEKEYLPYTAERPSTCS